jgi:alpha-L-fucosidase 2
MPTTRRQFLQGGLAAIALPRLVQQQCNPLPHREDELWYEQPARRWLEALPIGNGRIGGMIFGDPRLERIALSESTAWSGAPAADEINPGALPHLHQIRELFFAGRFDEAQSLCGQYLPGLMRNFGTNLPLPALEFCFDGLQEVTDYRRSLNLDTAVALVTFQSGATHFQREFLASHPAGVVALRFTSSRPGSVAFRMSFGSRDLPCTVAADGTNTLVLEGHAYEHLHSSGHDGVAVEIRACLLTEGGTLDTAEKDGIQVRGSHAATVLIAIATSFDGANPADRNRRTLELASVKTFPQLIQEHVGDYQPLYRRVSIDLGGHLESSGSHPTDARRKALEDGADDPALLALFFHYGRYLTIAGSRDDSALPLALQGIWNDGLASSMEWTDDYHLDINTEQNYWPAEVCNLSECQMPLFGLIDLMRSAGHATARQMYGAPGWVTHTVTNPWGYTAPGGVGWGIVVIAGVWIAQQLWDHYTFTADVGFLRSRAYPVLRDAAEFFLAYMVSEPRHGWLVTGPSDSPENWYVTPSGGRAAESMGPTIDRVLVYGLFSKCIEASQLLGVDQQLRGRLEAARAKLPPLQIGRHGQLQEWLEDFEDAEPNHRHTSHLVALYPEHQISPRTTPALARACEVTIQRRLSAPHWEQSEWGRANLVVYYARLLKGDDAHKYLVGLVAKAAEDNLLTFSSAGVAGATQNIFAIDGNTAGAAGIAEMLLQSQSGEIEFLPALPAAWPNGSVHGLCARGGYVVDMVWQRGQLVSATIASRRGGSAPVRYGNRTKTIHLRPGQLVKLGPGSFKSD